MPLSPGISHSHLSPKSKPLSTSPNFNPFAPLSPHKAQRQLDDADSTMMVGSLQRRVYHREEMLRIASDCRRSGWTIPKSLRPLDQWYGSNVKAPVEDPAIASIGQGPGRKAPGFGEGFGFGGGIGGKVLGRGARQTGHGQAEARSRRTELDSNGLPHPAKANLGAQMGKFSVKSPLDRTKLAVGDENRRARDDWRSAAGHLPNQRSDHRQERRQNPRHEDETVQPAWMDDHSSIDPAIVQETHESQPFQFGLGEDPIAAHKRMMKAAAEARPGDGRQNRSIPAGHIATSTLDPSQTTKISKQFNAADYLLPSKGSPGSRPDSTSDTSQLKQSSSHSRFQRFFGASQPDSIMQAVPGGRPIGPQKPLDSFDGLSAGLRSPPPKFDVDATDIPPQSLSGHPPGLVSPPPQDHASRLMGLLTSKNVGPPHSTLPSAPRVRPTSPPSHEPFHHPQYTSPPPGVPIFPHPPGIFDPHKGQPRDLQHPQGHLPALSAFPPHFQQATVFAPYPPMPHSSHPYPPPMGSHGLRPPPPPPPTAFRQDHAYGLPASGYGEQAPGQLPSKQQTMLAALYGDMQHSSR